MNFGFREHLATVMRHWGKIVLVIMASVMVTGAIAFLSSRVYVSEARILILNSSPAERVSRTIVTDAAGVTSSPQEQVMTQVEIIQSPALAEELAIRLGPERVLEEMTWRWDWLRDLPDTLKDRAISALYGIPVTADLLRGVGIAEPGGAEAGGPPVGAARDEILDAMHAEAIVRTDMFGVAYAAPSPEFAAEVLNGLIDIYVSRVVDLGRPVDAAAVAQQEADRLERVLREAETELRSFAQEFDILSIDRQKDLLLSRWSRTQEALSEARLAALETEKRLAVLEEEIASLPRNEAISVTTQPNPVVDRLRERALQLQTDLQRFVAGSAARDRIEREIDAIQRQLADEDVAVRGQQTTGASSLFQQLRNTATIAEAEGEATQARILFLERELEQVEQELRRIDSHEMTYRQLARNVEVKEEAYRFALQKREETLLQSQLAQPSLSTVVPVERGAVPDVPVSPRRARLLVLGVAAGILAGIGLAYLLEFARRTVSTPREAELAVGLPVLALTERYGLLSRRLKRTRLEMRRFAVWIMGQPQPSAGGMPRPLRLLFSSSHRRSGQTALVGELARTLHQQGANVLTLQLHLRQGGAQKTEFQDIAGDGAGPKNRVAVVRAPAYEMARILRELCAPSPLAIAPFGETVVEAARAVTPPDRVEDTPDDAAEDATGSVAEEAAPGVGLAVPRAEATRAADFDVVLIDAPDFGRFPEQGALVALSDLVLPVIEADRTRLAEIRSQLDDLAMMHANVPGLLLTKRRQTQSSWAFSWLALTQRRAMERAA